MKTSLLHFIALFLFCVIGLNAQTDRNVMWVHGLGGSTDSWGTNSRFHGATYRMNCKNSDYKSRGGGGAATANFIKNEFKTFFGPRATEPSNIVVSHSFGGLATRKLEKDNYTGGTSQNFGGQILVQSSQGGAALAENFESGLLAKKGAEILDNLTKALKSDFIDDKEVKIATNVLESNPFLKEKLGLNDILNLLKQYFPPANYLPGDELWGLVESKLQMSDFYDPDKIKDLNPKSDFIKELQNFDSPGQLITIYGTEESNLFERVFSSGTFKPGNKTLDVVSDQNKMFQVLASIYEFNSSINRAAGIAADWSGWNLRSKIFTGHNTPFHERARLWGEGKDYIENDLELDWMIGIGALSYKTETVSQKELTAYCRDQLAKLSDMIEEFHVTGEFKSIKDVQIAINELQNRPDCYEWNTLSREIPVYKPSDGVVLLESQQAAGGVMFENKNCNHFEALNTKVMSANFKDIFQQGKKGTTWFKTLIR